MNWGYTGARLCFLPVYRGRNTTEMRSVFCCAEWHSGATRTHKGHIRTMTTVVAEHNKQILDQFTRQAVPFAAAPAISNEDSLRVLVHAVGVTAHDTVLDVACGPGLVACTLAAHAQQVTGVDLVPAMLEEAQKLQI